MYVKVVVDINAYELNKLFTYKVNEEIEERIDIGTMVFVPFGKKNTLKRGYVVEKINKIEKTTYAIKEIDSIVEGLSVETELIKLAEYIRDRYVTSFSAALQMMIPGKQKVKDVTKKYIYLTESSKPLVEYIEKNKEDKRLTKRIYLLQSLYQEYYCKGINIIAVDEIKNRYDVSLAMLKTIEKLQLFKIEEERMDREISILKKRKASKKFTLNVKQQEAKEAIQRFIEKKEYHPFVLHGVTGSGKTEVYLQVIEKAIEKNQQAIVLIPEISLTPLMIRRFVERFGSIVGVLHSRLSKGERYEQWQKAKDGKTKIMIGPRSAIFAPFQNLGIIVVDEEHEHTYKSETSPRIQAKEIAIWRAKYHNVPIVFGSATPAIETYKKAIEGEYTLLELPAKAVKGASATIEIVDMGEELQSGNTDILSNTLYEAIKNSLEKKEQVLLFLNKRGYSGFISCRSCGFVYKCRHCDVSLTYHRDVKKMICHICGYEEIFSKTCPSCQSKYFKGFNIGTQKVETEMKRIFPKARICRMDQDTTSKKDSHEKIIHAFENYEYDIMIGTQMITKGHDFHRVTTVGILAADLSLHQENYLASENTFQLIHQMIGRTGRGKLAGKAIVQTYSPEHFSIVMAVKGDYKGFYKEETVYRELMKYPPYINLLQVVSAHKEYKILQLFMEQVKNLIVEEFAKEDEYTVLGPTPAKIMKVKDYYRMKILVKSNDYKKLTRLIHGIYNMSGKSNHIRIQADINPMRIY